MKNDFLMEKVNRITIIFYSISNIANKSKVWEPQLKHLCQFGNVIYDKY